MQRFSEQERFANSILELASSFEIIDGGCSGDGGGDDGGGGGAAGRILITDVALSK